MRDEGPIASKAKAPERTSKAGAQRRRNGPKPAGRVGAKPKRASAAMEIESQEIGPSTTLRDGSKGAAIVDLLRRKNGSTIAELAEATGWQAHSVRGFLSGTLKKKRCIPVVSEKGDNGERRYRIAS